MTLSISWSDLVNWARHAEVVVTVMTTLVATLGGLLTAVLLLYKKLRELQAELTRTNSVVAKVAQESGSPSAIEAAERLPQPPPEKVASGLEITMRRTLGIWVQRTGSDAYTTWVIVGGKNTPSNSIKMDNWSINNSKVVFAIHSLAEVVSR